MIRITSAPLYIDEGKLQYWPEDRWYSVKGSMVPDGSEELSVGEIVVSGKYIKYNDVGNEYRLMGWVWSAPETPNGDGVIDVTAGQDNEIVYTDEHGTHRYIMFRPDDTENLLDFIDR